MTRIMITSVLYYIGGKKYNNVFMYVWTVSPKPIQSYCYGEVACNDLSNPAIKHNIKIYYSHTRKL